MKPTAIVVLTQSSTKSPSTMRSITSNEKYHQQYPPIMLTKTAKTDWHSQTVETEWYSLTAETDYYSQTAEMALMS